MGHVLELRRERFGVDDGEAGDGSGEGDVQMPQTHASSIAVAAGRSCDEVARFGHDDMIDLETHGKTGGHQLDARAHRQTPPQLLEN